MEKAEEVGIAGMWKLIKYSFTMRRTQSAATLFTVAVSVAVLFALLLTLQGARAGVATAQDRLGADLLVVPAEAAAGIDQGTLLFTGAPVTMYLDEGLLAQVKDTEGVAAATGQFYGQTLDKGCCSATVPVRLIGFDAADDWVVSSWAGLPAGEPLGAGRVVIGCNVDGFESGSGTLLGQSVQVAAVLESTGTDLDGSIVADIDQVRRLAAAEDDFAGLWEEYGSPDGLLSAILVQVGDGRAADVKARLAELPGVSVIESSTVLESVSDQLYAMLSVMAFVAALMVAASLLQLFARFYSVVWERRSELALYRALGATRRDLMVLIGGEAAVLMGVGLAAGLVLGGALFAVVPAVLAGTGSFPFIVPGAPYVALCAVGVAAGFLLLALLAVAVPLRQSARISPAAAMQAGDID